MKDKLARYKLNTLERRANQAKSALRDMEIFIRDLEDKLTILVDHLGLQFEEVKKHTEIKVKEEQK